MGGYTAGAQELNRRLLPVHQNKSARVHSNLPFLKDAAQPKANGNPECPQTLMRFSSGTYPAFVRDHAVQESRHEDQFRAVLHMMPGKSAGHDLTTVNIVC